MRRAVWTMTLVWSALAHASDVDVFAFDAWQGWVDEKEIVLLPALSMAEGLPQLRADGALRLPLRIVGAGALPDAGLDAIAAQTLRERADLKGLAQRYVPTTWERVLVTRADGGVLLEQKLEMRGAGVATFELEFPSEREVYDAMEPGAQVQLVHRTTVRDVMAAPLDARVAANAWVTVLQDAALEPAPTVEAFFAGLDEKLLRAALPAIPQLAGTAEFPPVTGQLLATLGPALGIAVTTPQAMERGHSAARPPAQWKLAAASTAWLGARKGTHTTQQLAEALRALDEAELLQFANLGLQWGAGAQELTLRFNRAQTLALKPPQRHAWDTVVLATPVTGHTPLHPPEALQGRLLEGEAQVHQTLFGTPRSVKISNADWLREVAVAMRTPHFGAFRYLMRDETRRGVKNLDLDARVYAASGERLLHLAARSGQDEFVAALLKAGANSTLPDDEGHLPVSSKPAAQALLERDQARRGTATIELGSAGGAATQLAFTWPTTLAPNLKVTEQGRQVTFSSYPMTRKFTVNLTAQYSIPMELCRRMQFKREELPYINKCTVLQPITFEVTVRLTEEGPTRYRVLFSYGGDKQGLVVERVTEL